MNGKIRFGVDFLHLFWEDKEKNRERKIDGQKLLLIRFLLHIWGFTTTEFVQIQQVYDEEYLNSRLDPVDVVMVRIAKNLIDEPLLQKRLISHLAAINFIDAIFYQADLNDNWGYCLEYFQTFFQIDQSEFVELIDQGIAIITRFNQIAITYNENSISKKLPSNFNKEGQSLKIWN